MIPKCWNSSDNKFGLILSIELICKTEFYTLELNFMFLTLKIACCCFVSDQNKIVSFLTASSKFSCLFLCTCSHG